MVTPGQQAEPPTSETREEQALEVESWPTRPHPGFTPTPPPVWIGGCALGSRESASTSLTLRRFLAVK